MFVWGPAHATLHIWKSEDNLWELVLFFSGTGMELRLSSFTCPKPLSHLTCHPRSCLMPVLALVKTVAMIESFIFNTIAFWVCLAPTLRKQDLFLLGKHYRM